MNCIKKHIIRKKLHLSRQQFRDLEYKINLIKKITKPIFVAFITKTLVLGLKELTNPKIDLDFRHHPKHKKHFIKHNYFKDHLNLNGDTIINLLIPILESLTPLILSAFEEYKLNYPNSPVVNILKELIEKRG